MTATVYTVNLDYRCNERCVFCAADLGGEVAAAVRRPSLGLDQVSRWLADDRPEAGDIVVVSGGEPTLHRQLIPVVQWLAAGGASVVLFTNGMRLSDPALTRATAEAGVRRYEISLYGATAAAHDEITCHQGSFARTLKGLRELTTVRREIPVVVSIRLLVSRQTHAANPDIVRLVAEEVGEVDVFGVHQLVRSSDALASGAPVSWADARGSVNETARVVRDLGHRFEAPEVPLCVWDEDNLPFALESLRQRQGEDEIGFRYRYLDPLVDPREGGPRRRSAMPHGCLTCSLAPQCPRVERSYLLQFGEAGLTPRSSVPT